MSAAHDEKKATDKELSGRLGLFSASMIVVGSIIGSGIFKKTAPMLASLHSEKLVLLSWILAGLITLFGALTYAEVANRLAQTGGLYAYLRTMFGPKTAFLFGWACFSVIQSASIASIAYVCSEAFLHYFNFSTSDLTLKMTAAGIILLLSFVNFLGVAFGAGLENIFSSLKILGIGTIIFLGLSGWGHLAGVPVGSFPGESIITGTNSSLHGFAFVSAIFGAMLSAFWAFDGINNLGFIGGEIKNPKRNVPLALIIGVTGILGIYLLVNCAYFSALPEAEIQELTKNSGHIFAVEVMLRAFGSFWAQFVSVLILVSTFGATNASVMTSARIYFAMAKDGVLPPSFARSHARFKTPWLALLAQAVWSCGLIFSGSFDELTDRLIFASFLFYGLGAFGLILLRRRTKIRASFQVPLIVPVVYAVFCLCLVLVTIVQNPVQAGEGLALIALGLPFLSRIGRRKGHEI